MSQPRKHISPEEYLTLERAAEVKSEYYLGEMFAMSGGSRAHSLIAGNIVTALNIHFKGRSCEVHGSDMRVKVSETGLYTYPDASAFCGEGEFEDKHVDTLLNPQLIVEVLSPTTEKYDRIGKFAQYRTISSLQEYVLIAQDRVYIERCRRHAGDEFLSRIYLDLDDVVELESVGATLSVRDVYARVEFDDESIDPKTPEEQEG